MSPDGTMTVEIDERHVGIGTFAAERILVSLRQPAPAVAGAPG